MDAPEVQITNDKLQVDDSPYKSPTQSPYKNSFVESQKSSHAGSKVLSVEKIKDKNNDTFNSESPYK